MASRAKTSDVLNSRYDELKSGRVRPIAGDEVEAYFREKSAAARRRNIYEIRTITTDLESLNPKSKI